jgi:predicted Zn-dependent peptidase
MKRLGEDPNKMAVDKPEITKVEVNREAESAFLKTLKATKSSNIQPQFLDFEKDILKTNLSNGLQVLYAPNKENQLFQLSYRYEIGTYAEQRLSVLFPYLNYLGSEKNDAEAFKNKMFALGCTFYAYSGKQYVTVSLSGLSSKMNEAIALVEELLNTPKANDEALKNVISDIIKSREDLKKDKESILFSGMRDYLLYGDKNPSNSELKNADLEKLTSAELLALLKKVLNYKHTITYYGPAKMEDLVTTLQANRKLVAQPENTPEKVRFIEKENTEPVVYWYNFDMVQAELLFSARLGKYDKSQNPEVTMYNEYFGGGMNAIVFQEMRESRALAYSVSASFRNASSLQNYNAFNGYIGTQADKLSDAMSGMMDITRNMPLSEKAFETAKKSVLSRMESERITKEGKIFSYLSLKEMGLTYDIRKDVYEKAKTMTLKDVKAFQEKNIKNLKFSIAVIGSKDKLNFETLKKYGKVIEINFEQLFGY